MFKARLQRLSLLICLVLLGLSSFSAGFVGSARAADSATWELMTARQYSDDQAINGKTALEKCDEDRNTYGTCISSECLEWVKKKLPVHIWTVRHYDISDCSNCEDLASYNTWFMSDWKFSATAPYICPDYKVELVKKSAFEWLYTSLNNMLLSVNDLMNSVAVGGATIIDALIEMIFLVGPEKGEITITGNEINAGFIVSEVRPVLQQAWMWMRNIVNIFFLGVLIFVAFVNIIWANKWWNQASYTIKSYLPKFVLAVVAVNFSWLICMFLLDQGIILGKIVLEMARIVDQNSVENVTESGVTYASTISSFRLSRAQFIVEGTNVSQLLIMKQAFVALFLNLVLIVFTGILLVVFAWTVLKCWILIIISPLIWIGFLIDKLKGDLWTKWWTHFISVVTISAKLTLVLYIWTIFLKSSITLSDNEGKALLLFAGSWGTQIILKLILTVGILAAWIWAVVKSDEHMAKAIGIGKKLGGAVAIGAGTLGGMAGITALKTAGKIWWWTAWGLKNFNANKLKTAGKVAEEAKRLQEKSAGTSNELTHNEALKKAEVKVEKSRLAELDKKTGRVRTDDQLLKAAEKNVKWWILNKAGRSAQWLADSKVGKFSGLGEINEGAKEIRDGMNKGTAARKMAWGAGKAALMGFGGYKAVWLANALSPHLLPDLAKVLWLSAAVGSGTAAVSHPIKTAKWMETGVKEGWIAIGRGYTSMMQNATNRAINRVDWGTRAMMQGDQQLGEYRQGAGTVHYNRAALNKHFKDKSGKDIRDASGNVVGLSNNEKSNEKAMAVLQKINPEAAEKLSRKMNRVRQHEVTHRTFNDHLDEGGRKRMVDLLNDSNSEKWATFKQDEDNKKKFQNNHEMADEFLAQVVSGDQKVDDKLEAGIRQTIAQNMKSQGVEVDMSFDKNTTLGDKLEAVDAHLAPDEKLHAVFDNLGSPDKGEKENYEKAARNYKEVKNDYETAQRVSGNKSKLKDNLQKQEQLMDKLTDPNSKMDEFDRQELEKKFKKNKSETRELVEQLNNDTGKAVNVTDEDWIKSAYNQTADSKEELVEKMKGMSEWSAELNNAKKELREFQRLDKMKKEKEEAEDVIDRYESDYGAYMQTDDLVQGRIAHQKTINDAVGTGGGAPFETTRALEKNQAELTNTLLELQKTIANMEANGLKVDNQGQIKEDTWMGKIQGLLSEKMKKSLGIDVANVMQKEWFKSKMGALSKGYFGTMMQRQMGLDAVHNQLKAAKAQAKQFNEMIGELRNLEKEVKNGTMTEQQAMEHLEGRLQGIGGEMSNKTVVNETVRNVTNETVVNREVEGDNE